MRRHFLVGLLTVASSACGGTATAPSDGGSQAATTVTIRFKAKVGSADFVCGQSYAAIGSTQVAMEPRDLRFFVQDVKLIDDRGLEVPVTIVERAPWQAPSVALLDFEDGAGHCEGGDVERNDVVVGTVAPGRYSGLVFTVGVPEALSHADPAQLPLPLKPGGMYWGWAGGHLFLKADMTAPDAGSYASIHLGSTGCPVDHTERRPCAHPNRNIVRLPAFDPASNVAVLDVGALFAETDLVTPQVCAFGEESCAPLYGALGISPADGSPLPTAPAFRIE